MRRPLWARMSILPSAPNTSLIALASLRTLSARPSGRTLFRWKKVQESKWEALSVKERGDHGRGLTLANHVELSGLHRPRPSEGCMGMDEGA